MFEGNQIKNNQSRQFFLDCHSFCPPDARCLSFNKFYLNRIMVLRISSSHTRALHLHVEVFSHFLYTRFVFLSSSIFYRLFLYLLGVLEEIDGDFIVSRSKDEELWTLPLTVIVRSCSLSCKMSQEYSKTILKTGKTIIAQSLY